MFQFMVEEMRIVNKESILEFSDQLLEVYNSFLSQGGSRNDNYEQTISTAYELFQSTLSLMARIYGAGSIQVDNLHKQVAAINARSSGDTAAVIIMGIAVGALRTLKREIQAGLIGSLQQQFSGEVLTDFLQLSRAAFNESGDDAKNVAAVLAAALFEDTLRRLAKANGIPHIEKLQDVLIELKGNNVLQGAEVGIAQSYLNFRNSSLHAQWDKIDRPSVASVHGFVEGLLMKHFS
jgi:hypothetical protein